MNTPTNVSRFNLADLVPDVPDEDSAEEECDCPFPWWWLVVAAAAGGGLGYWVGSRKRQREDDELPLEP